MPSEVILTRRWLIDILHHADLVRRFVTDVGYESFKDDPLRLHAVTRCLEIISEASRRLPDELKARHISIAWKEMAAAGNVYRHDYEDVSASFVWVTAQNHLPILRQVIDIEPARLDGPCDTELGDDAPG